MSDTRKATEQTEKLATQAETGGGRTAARPGPAGAAAPPDAMTPSGMSGAETNDAMPQGGATGDRVIPDTIKPGATE